MLGKTHITTGIASAIIISHPNTVPGVMAAVVGGGIGGWIVDIDCKRSDADYESVLDSVIDGLFISAFIAIDYLFGDGMCQYVIDHWGFSIWVSLILFIVLMLIGKNSSHRTFTHSFLGLVLFSTCILYICPPALIPFASGYLSHLVLDLFNMRGLQILYPIKWRPCLEACSSKGKANKVIFWIAFAADAVLGAFFFSSALLNSGGSLELFNKLKGLQLFGLNSLQLYLLFINIISFLGFERSWQHRERELSTDETVTIILEFETWVLDFIVVIGGAVGMLLALIIHLAFPSSYNGMWWAFCYSSNVIWFTIYNYVCNPFGLSLNSIQWMDQKHIPLLLYLVGINLLSMLLVLIFRKRHLNEYSAAHTLLIFVGALGGTVGAYPTTVAVHRDKSFSYIITGFPLMLISQVIIVMYFMAAGVI